MRISNTYPDPVVGCTMFPEDAAPDEFGFGFDVAADVPRVGSGLDDPPSIRDVGSGLDDPPSIRDVGSGLGAPEPPPLDPNNPADSLKVRSGL
jgi:hypothetical protein